MRAGLILIAAVGLSSGCAGMRRCREVWHQYHCHHAGEDLRCALSAEPVVEAGGSVAVRFTLTNTTRSTTFHFITRGTPIGGVDTHIFRVHRAGERLRFDGVYADWFPARCIEAPCDFGTDYRSLAPGESVSEVVDLREVYDVAAPGQYTISLQGSLVELVAGAAAPYHGPRRTRPPGRFRRGVVDCNPVTVTVRPR